MLSEKPWQADRVLLFFIRLCASMFLGMLLVSFLHISKFFTTDEVQFAAVVINVVSVHGVAIVLTQRFLREHGFSWEEAFGLVTYGLARPLWLAFVAACASLPVALALAILSARTMKWLHLKPSMQDPVQMLQQAGSVPLKCVIGLLAIVVAPFIEEVIFRGLIYPTIKRYSSARLAMWTTSLLFATIHFNLGVLLPLTFLAVIWTLLYETTGNLFAPISAHGIFNLVNFVLALTQSANPLGVPSP